MTEARSGNINKCQINFWWHEYFWKFERI